MKFRLILIAFGLIAGIYSCSNSTENSDVLTKPTIEILASDPVPMQIKSIINVLGLAIEKPNPYINSPSDKEASVLSAKEGVIIEFGYHDNFFNEDLGLKINEELSTENNLVFDGTSKNIESGKTSFIRHSICLSDNNLTFKKQSTKFNEPISKNVEWNDNGTYKYTTKSNEILEYKIKSDGTELYLCKYISNTSTAITQINEDGSSNKLKNISIFQK